MKFIGKILALVLLGINALVVLLMLVSAYSPYIDPYLHPMWSCSGLLFPVFLLANFLFLCFWAIVYWRYAFFPLVAFFCCWGSIRTYFPINFSQDEAPENAIKILSYNTCAFGNREKHTKAKPNRTLSYLQESDADIICLQEYIVGGKLKKKDVDYALRKYPYRHYHKLGKSNSRNGLGCYSKYPILSVTPIKYNSVGNGSVAYQIKVGNDTLLVINNHLETNRISESDVDIYNNDVIESRDGKKMSSGMWKLMKKMAAAIKIRAKQAEAVAEHAEGFQGKGVVFCGDLNDTPISYAHRMMSEGMKDAYTESGNGPGFSYNQHRMFFRIDHILLSKNLKAYYCTVDNSIDASDHYPIWCYISWE